MYIVHNIPSFGDLTTISWKYNRPSGNRLKQQFLRNMPWWKLLTNDRSVIIFYRSCDYISYLLWTSEYSEAETGNLCYIAVFWLSAALISFSRCLLVCWHEITSFEIFRSRTLKWINIIVLRTLRRKNYSCGFLRVIYLSEKTAKQVICRSAI